MLQWLVAAQVQRVLRRAVLGGAEAREAVLVEQGAYVGHAVRRCVRTPGTDDGLCLTSCALQRAVVPWADRVGRLEQIERLRRTEPVEVDHDDQIGRASCRERVCQYV